MNSKLGALIGVPTTTVAALGTADVIDPKTSAVVLTILGAVHLALWAVFSPSVPWLGPEPPAGPQE